MENDAYSIAVVAVYFGTMPWYINFFLQSCRLNVGIDFFLITDYESDKLFMNSESNVHVVYKSFAEIKDLIADKININIDFDQPYKLCDFRPAFGVIFEEIVKNYDFWGVCDVDVIFGDIRDFINNQVLENFDIIGIRSEYITGFFSLYRNCAVTNTLFKESNDWAKIFTSNHYYGFDECGLLCSALAAGERIDLLPCEIESITHVIKRPDIADRVKVYLDFHSVEGIPGKLFWNKGKLFYDDRFEVLLYHLISFKVHPNLEIPKWDMIPEAFCINEYSFSKCRIKYEI